MAVQYSQLVNKNGTIYNTATGQGYSTPQQLAADLGISASSIQWGNIQQNSNYTPQSSTQQSAMPAVPGVVQAGGTYNPQQTTTSPLQGSSPQIQGSSPNLQGSSPQLQQQIQPTLTEQRASIAAGQPGSPWVASVGTGYSSSNTQIPQPGQQTNPYQNSGLTPGDQAFLDSMNQLAQQQYQQGAANFSINSQTMQQALQLAQNDPAIKAKYGDAAIIAQKDLMNNLGQLNSEYAQQFGLLNAQQTQERKNLESQIASQGQAYSGFRRQAEDLQKQQQTGVIQSTTRQLQQSIRSLGSQYEQQYGTAALGQQGQLSAAGQSYQPYGGIQGTVPFQQKADVENKQLQEYQTISNPLNK